MRIRDVVVGKCYFVWLPDSGSYPMVFMGERDGEAVFRRPSVMNVALESHVIPARRILRPVDAEYLLILKRRAQESMGEGKEPFLPMIRAVDALIDFREALLEFYCRCGAPKGEPAPCPYAEELHGDDTPCACCDGCRSGCALDI